MYIVTLFGRATNFAGPYGYTGEWYGGYIDLLFLRARWYTPEMGTFLSVDPVESEPPYQYVGGNVANRVDPSGMFAQECEKPPYDGFVEGYQIRIGGWLIYLEDILLGLRPWQDIYFTYAFGGEWVFDFEHKEMAHFSVAGEVMDLFNVGSISVSTYSGQIDGFRNYDGIDGYSGPFIGYGGNLGLTFGIGGGLSDSVAYPANEYVTIEKSILDAAKTVSYPDLMKVHYKGFYIGLGIEADAGIPGISALASALSISGLPIAMGFETSTTVSGLNFYDKAENSAEIFAFE